MMQLTGRVELFALYPPFSQPGLTDRRRRGPT